MSLLQVPIGRLPPERFRSILPTDAFQAFEQAVAIARQMFEGRVIWNVNSTARGGGVAELLRSLLAYARGAEVDARWIVIQGDPAFFHVTKRMHNHLHGALGDGGDLADDERDIYERTLASNAEELKELVKPEDVVLLHDPQTAGLIADMKETGAAVVWRCHVGLDFPNELARTAWRFLIPYVSQAHAYVFSRRAFLWEGLEEDKVTIVPPSIDAFSPKNQDLPASTVSAIVAAAQLVDETDGLPTFTREDGAPARVDRRAVLYDGGPPAPSDVPLVVQVSRWDRLKDPVGVIEGFARYIAPRSNAHLVVAGPSVEAVADDPEGAEVLQESLESWRKLDRDVAERIHLACLPMEDGEENAAIVNALQRRATVVVQKSLAEGFGLTVAEAMWKARPVVASRIGGIQDQIVDGVTGVLVDDPRSLESYGEAVGKLLDDPARATRMGMEAQRRIRDEFLGPRHLIQYVQLLGKLLGAPRGS